MNKITLALRNSFIAGLILLLVGVMPVPVFAQDSGSDTSNTSSASQTTEQPPVEKPTTGTTGPTGAAAWTYWYNEGTGLWENDYYTYNPSTKETVPKAELEYTYNAVTGLWDTEIWQYSAAAGSYRKSPVSVTAPPEGAITHGGPIATQQVPPSVQQAIPSPADGAASSAASSSALNQNEPSTSSSTTPSSPQTLNSNNINGGALSFSNSGTITNYLNSTAQSGNAVVIANTTAGNATSGDASAMANIVNLLQSQSSFGGSGMATFTANIQGNVQGDFLIDPARFMQPAGQPTAALSHLQVNSQNEGTISNNITLDARSGDASAAMNTTVGNVTSGDANAIANVVNMINSVVAANQSFMGIINIHGDYSGNILMPTESLNALLASAGTDNITAATTDINNTSTQTINNNIDLSAVSGNARASQNTSTGSVTSGNGLTNLTLLNMTGRKIVAANSLLVFVNVLGNWVGLIMDAPAGTTSAALGGGVHTNTSTNLANRADVNTSENFGITNNIGVGSKSGDASATQNTTVGYVKSGNAAASANVANVIDSNFSLSNWFGVLFINVFGTWRGNFGTAKPPVVQPVTSGIAGPARGATHADSDMRIFAFTPKTSSSSAANNLELSPLSEAQQTGTITSSEVLAKVSKVLSSSTGKGLATSATVATDSVAFNWSSLVLAFGLAGFGFIGIDRVRTNLRNRRLASRQ